MVDFDRCTDLTAQRFSIYRSGYYHASEIASNSRLKKKKENILMNLQSPLDA